MAIPFDTLLEESKCYLCLGISQAHAMELALLNRIASDSGVKIYEANVSQQGTNAPVSSVLKNTLGGTPVWSRVGPGIYVLTLAGAFPQAKMALYINAVPMSDPPNNINFVGLQVGDGINTVGLSTQFGDVSAGWAGMDFADDVIGQAVSVLIKVYP